MAAIVPALRTTRLAPVLKIFLQLQGGRGRVVLLKFVERLGMAHETSCPAARSARGEVRPHERIRELGVPGQEELERRIGHAIVAEMTSDELERFQEAQSAGDGTALAVLEEALPERRPIVLRTFSEVTNEIPESAPTVLHELA